MKFIYIIIFLVHFKGIDIFNKPEIFNISTIENGTCLTKYTGIYRHIYMLVNVKDIFFNWANIGIFETIRLTQNFKLRTLPTFSSLINWCI